MLVYALVLVAGGALGYLFGAKVKAKALAEAQAALAAASR
jgi:hypothetical protein